MKLKNKMTSIDPIVSILKAIIPQISYQKKIIQHTVRVETDVMVICQPKPFRKRFRLFSEKIVIVHKKEDDEFDILEI